jgi:aryl-alcohol dehydrogenase-like predicted oxidoreductase
MIKRELGKSGIQIAPLALGANVFGWTIDQASSFRVLDAFVDAGYNLIDTADVYSRWAPGNKGGESETIIGNWLKQEGKRDKVIIATKLGKEMGPGQKGLSQSYINEALEKSLTRLQTDYIDLYQAHEDDPTTDMEETLGCFAGLIKAGKIKAIGASNFSAGRLARALQISEQSGLPRYESLQPLYNLYDRLVFEDDLEPLCLENKIAVLSYYSLASGFLTGKYRSEKDLMKSARGRGIGKYLNKKGFAILDVLDQVSSQYQSSPATVALAWLIQRNSVTAPIASATSIAQLGDLLKAPELHLDYSAIEMLNNASA